MDNLKIALMPFLIVAFGFISLEIGIPIAIGEIVAGLIGRQFIDIESIPLLKPLYKLGLLGIMFIAGLEIDLSTLKSHLKTNTVIGLSSFILPFVAISAICKYAFNLDLTESLAIGASLSTASLAIIFTTLKQHKLLYIEEGQVIFGSAMMVAIISIIVLTILSFEGTLRNIIYLLILIVVLFFIKKIALYIFSRYKGNLFEFELKFFLILLLGLGILAEEAGLNSGLIAFFAGIMFSRLDKYGEEILNKLSTLVFSLLGPIFFFYAGILINIGSVVSNSLILFILLLFVSLMMKYLGTYLSFFYFYKRNKQQAKYAALTHNHQLTFGIAISMDAYQKGLIAHSSLSIILLILLLSSIASIIFCNKEKAF